MSKIIVVGSINMDIVLQVPHVPKVGETLFADQVKYFDGGKGANQAIAASKLGGDVYMIGKIGNDANGKRLIENLKNNSVNTDGVTIDKTQSTGTAYINVYASGENNIIVNKGANERLTVDDIKRLENILEKDDICVMQMEIPLEVVSYVIQTFKKKNIKVILNPAPADKAINSDLNGVSIVIPNETELGILTDIDMDSDEDIVDATQKLLDMGPEAVIVTLGRKGSFYRGKEAEYWQEPISVKPIDTTGAGDSFIGALSVFLSEGNTIKDSIEFATYASALTVTKEGAMASLPTREEVDSFMREAKEKEK